MNDLTSQAQNHSFELALRALKRCGKAAKPPIRAPSRSGMPMSRGQNPRLSTEIESRLRHSARLTDAEIDALYDLHLAISASSASPSAAACPSCPKSTA